MNKFWMIFKHEYRRHVLRRRFLLALLSVPLWFVFAVGLGILSVALQVDSRPVGYVDLAGVIKHNRLVFGGVPFTDSVEFEAFSDQAEARAALEESRIQAFFVLPEAYLAERAVRLVYHEEPSNLITSQFQRLVRYNLLDGQPAAERVFDGPHLVYESTSEARSAEGGGFLKALAPFIAGLFLVISVFTSSGYLMQAVVEEKENRTMEILATSASAGQIMNGKIMALISVGLTQVLAWSLPPVALLLFARGALPFLDSVALDWNILWLALVTALPTFVMMAALMTAIGASVTEASEGQQMMGLITMPVMAPYMLMPLLVANPGGPLAMGLSFFPLTACLTLLTRIGFASVPAWQVAVSAGLLVISAAGSLWLAARVFRLGMLRYGKQLGWKELFRLVLRRSQGDGYA